MTKVSKFETRKDLLLERFSKVYGESVDQLEKRFTTPRKQSVWFRIPLPNGFRQVAWMPFAASHDIISASHELALSFAQKDMAYIQNASSWLSVLSVDPKPGDRILDTCAAPGGKSLLMYQLAGGECEITANDASKSRSTRMHDLFTNFAAEITITTHKAQQLHHALKDQTFNKILVDAPCSGEGLLNLSDSSSLNSWSKQGIERLAQQQRSILHATWQLLDVGGSMIYSTCTVSPDENEVQITKFLDSHDDADIATINTSNDIPRAPIVEQWGNTIIPADVRDNTLRIAHEGYFEAFYVAKLIKRQPNQ